MNPSEARSKAFEWQCLREMALAAGDAAVDFLDDAQDIERELAVEGYDVYDLMEETGENNL